MRYANLGAGEDFHIIGEDGRTLCNHKEPEGEIYDGDIPEPRCKTCVKRWGFPT